LGITWEEVKAILKRNKTLIITILSLLFSLAIGTIVIYICGYDIRLAYSALIKGSFGTLNSLVRTLEKSVPFIFCGLAASIAIKSGMFNIGGDGQFILGALGYTLAALFLDFLPGISHVLISCIIGVLFGTLWAFIPAIMKVKVGANEVVTTIMMNFIAMLLVTYLVSGPLIAEGSVPETKNFVESVVIHKIFPGKALTWGFVCAIIPCMLHSIFMKLTVFGYSIMAAGMNERAAQAGGIRPKTIRIGAMMISGAIAGLGGAMMVGSSFGRLTASVSSGYGFAGIAIAFLGQHSSVGIALSSLLFAALHTGSLYMEMFEGVPTEIVSLLQGVVIVIVASPLIFDFVFQGRRQK